MERPNDIKIKKMKKKIEVNILNIREVIKQIKKLSELFNEFIINIKKYFSFI